MVNAAGKYVRANYRLTGGKVDINTLESVLVRFRVSLQHTSAGDGVFTFSMNGYGRPAWAQVIHATAHEGWASGPFVIGNISVSDGTSVFYMSMGAGFSNSTAVASGGTSIAFASLPATVTFPFFVVALIASR